ncbi:uncharacterized protein PFL1_04137 [Pseudozyma flocculosa PF-1]|uniref:Dipeptidase n=2 Tax=Pseudozyma flocculosa TaxID=84751 RepID=A0A5C3EVD7_9BASI|nr:uncharacterized protein PFL1_04137 [Pseudozyma flocculosa PF-1]EPQ28310.1 hypothetical protein PFL1_04137 [Pseudozyma flocculosa PF-1]SPO35457.1 related to Microsomal dipeptidase precursor [Pseudozyma flocculosa]
MSQLLPVHDAAKRSRFQSARVVNPATAPPRSPRRSLVLTLSTVLVAIVCLLLLLPSGAQSTIESLFYLHVAPVHRRILYPSGPLARASALLRHHPLIDGHIDVPVYARYRYANKLDTIPFDAPAWPNGSYPTSGQVDIPRLRKGRSGGFFWSAYVPCPRQEAPNGSDTAVRDTLEQMDVIRQLIDRYSHDFELVSTAREARRAFRKGRLVSFIGLEGGHSLGSSLFALRAYASLFAKPGHVGPLRYLTLTHTCHNVFADSSGEQPPRWNGLSAFGQHLIKELNRLGIVPDLSHVSDQTASQTIDVSQGPVMLSHSSARALNDVPRNAPDWLLGKLALAWKEQGKDSVVMINVFPGFIGGSEDLDQVVRHIQHVASIVGRDHVGIGSDFDGITEVPRGFEDVSKYPHLVARLIQIGWTDSEIAGFVGENVLRVLEAAEELAAKLQQRGTQPDYTSWQDLENQAAERLATTL